MSLLSKIHSVVFCQIILCDLRGKNNLGRVLQETILCFAEGLERVWTLLGPNTFLITNYSQCRANTFKWMCIGSIFHTAVMKNVGSTENTRTDYWYLCQAELNFFLKLIQLYSKMNSSRGTCIWTPFTRASQTFSQSSKPDFCVWNNEQLFFCLWLKKKSIVCLELFASTVDSKAVYMCTAIR